MNYYLKDFIIRNIKIINIGWTNTFYFFTAIIVIHLLDLYYGKFNEEEYENKSNMDICIEFLIYIWLISISIYIIRNVFISIPFPFDGYLGYNHMRVKEIQTASIYTIFVLAFNKRMQGYYKIISKRINI